MRTVSKKGSGRAAIFQHAAILDLVVYQNELNRLQRIKEFKWSFLYQHIFSDVPKNAVALFMVELLTKALKQPETNIELFHFCENAFMNLDNCSEEVMANFSLFFALHLATNLGFGMQNNFSETNKLFDLKEGIFVSSQPTHTHFLNDKQATITADLLKATSFEDLEAIKLNHNFRRSLLLTYINYYSLHIHDFGTMKTLPVLSEILN